MSYTYLQYVNKILERYNQGSLTSTTFVTTTDPVQLRAKSAINDAIATICSYHNFEWNFLRSNKTQVLSAGTQNYSLDSTAVNVDWNSFHINYDAGLTNKDAKKLTNIQLEVYRYYWEILDKNVISSDQYNKPSYVVDKGDGTFTITPVPDEAYTVAYTVFVKPTILSTYSDTTEIPDRFEHVILSGASYFMDIYMDDEQSAVVSSTPSWERGISRMFHNLHPRPHYMISKGY